jgi:hypothetical protein
VRTLVAAAMSFGVAFGASEVALPAFGLAEGSASLGPTVFAALAVGSVGGGLVYGAASPRTSCRSTSPAAAGVPLGLLALCLADSAPAMLLLAPLAGVMLAPLTAAENELAGRLAPPGAVTEAYAWVITATVLGFSLGTGLAGSSSTRPTGARPSPPAAGSACSGPPARSPGAGRCRPA